MQRSKTRSQPSPTAYIYYLLHAGIALVVLYVGPVQAFMDSGSEALNAANDDGADLGLGALPVILFMVSGATAIAALLAIAGTLLAIPGLFLGAGWRKDSRISALFMLACGNSLLLAGACLGAGMEAMGVGLSAALILVQAGFAVMSLTARQPKPRQSRKREATS